MRHRFLSITHCHKLISKQLQLLLLLLLIDWYNWHAAECLWPEETKGILLFMSCSVFLSSRGSWGIAFCILQGQAHRSPPDHSHLSGHPGRTEAPHEDGDLFVGLSSEQPPLKLQNHNVRWPHTPEALCNVKGRASCVLNNNHPVSQQLQPRAQSLRLWSGHLGRLLSFCFACYASLWPWPFQPLYHPGQVKRSWTLEFLLGWWKCSETDLWWWSQSWAAWLKTVELCAMK